MNSTVARLFLFCATILVAPLATSAITIPTVPVGNPANANDPVTGNLYGGVAYDYRIGTYEVTNAQYAAFLNAKAASDPLSLYDTQMGIFGGGAILRSGISGSFTYTVNASMGNKPVSFVNWYDAIRFANWMNNGQGAGDTETGAYTLLGGTRTPTNANLITRNPGATWFLPDSNEWHKAAYYQPAAQGGDSDNYWLYPTASNSPPAVAGATSTGDISNPGANVANYNSSADWNGVDGNSTSVGSAGPLSQSFYGTYDQGGNAWEWTETLSRLPTGNLVRGRRGGGANSTNVIQLAATADDAIDPTSRGAAFGFRVATVPEPASIVMGLMSAAALGAVVIRKRRMSQ